MSDFLSVFLPRSMTRLPDGSYVVLNGAGRVMDPVGTSAAPSKVPGLRVRLDPMPVELGDGANPPEVIWLYEAESPPAPGTTAWAQYAGKLEALATCPVANAAADARYIEVPGYGRFLAR